MLYSTLPNFNNLEPLQNIVRNGEIVNQHFLLFPQCFLSYQKDITPFEQQRSCYLQTHSIWDKAKTSFSWYRVHPFPNKPLFLRVCSTSLMKTLWEKEKLLMTSNFSFSNSVFYPFRELSTVLIKFKIVICKFFEFGRV